MKEGDRVICRVPRGYPFTEGKEYTVIRYEPSSRDGHFTWPDYVHVTNDWGLTSVCHAHRFEVIQ